MEFLIRLVVVFLPPGHPEGIGSLWANCQAGEGRREDGKTRGTQRRSRTLGICLGVVGREGKIKKETGEAQKDKDKLNCSLNVLSTNQAVNQHLLTACCMWALCQVPRSYVSVKDTASSCLSGV